MMTQSYGWNLQRLQHSRNNNFGQLYSMNPHSDQQDVVVRSNKDLLQDR